jgi:glyoxalase superfamily protein
MGTRLYSVVIDCADPGTLGGWWSDALRWPVTYEAPDEVVVEPSEDPPPPGIVLVFVPVPEPKQCKNRVHLDLASTSVADQKLTVGRLIDMGAAPVDIGQGDVDWVVLADPEGNELCVNPPDDRFDEPCVVESIVLDAANPGRLARFWAEATGWHLDSESHMVASLRHPSGRPPALDLLAVDDVKQCKNRVHLDVAPGPSDDQQAETERLVRLGARRIDIGQGEVTWVVLADPEDNEFCVLSPR